jgi:hypothetical protein
MESAAESWGVGRHEYLWGNVYSSTGDLRGGDLPQMMDLLKLRKQERCEGRGADSTVERETRSEWTCWLSV